MKKLILLIGSLSFVQFCVNGTAQVEKAVATTPPTGITVSNVVVKDAGGQTLGHLIEGTDVFVRIINSTGYMYELNWGGNFGPAAIFFTTADCTGAPYTFSGLGAYGKRVFYDSFNNLLYKIKNLNADSTESYSSLLIQSGMSNTGCHASSSTWSSSELELVNRSDVGIPATIAAPLTLNF